MKQSNKTIILIFGLIFPVLIMSGEKVVIDLKVALVETADLAPAQAGAMVYLMKSDWASVSEFKEDVAVWMTDYERKKNFLGQQVVSLTLEVREPSSIRTGNLIKKQNITVLEYGVLGLLIYLLIELITGNCMVMYSKLCKNKQQSLPVQPIVQAPAQVANNYMKDNESSVDPYKGSNPSGTSQAHGPLDGLGPNEMTSRLQYLYHATSHPDQQVSYVDYKSNAVDRLEKDNASLSSYDHRMVDKTRYHRCYFISTSYG